MTTNGLAPDEWGVCPDNNGGPHLGTPCEICERVATPEINLTPAGEKLLKDAQALLDSGVCKTFAEAVREANRRREEVPTSRPGVRVFKHYLSGRFVGYTEEEISND